MSALDHFSPTSMNRRMKWIGFGVAHVWYSHGSSALAGKNVVLVVAVWFLCELLVTLAAWWPGHNRQPTPCQFLWFSPFSPELPLPILFIPLLFRAVTIWQEFENWGDTVPMRCATEMGNVNDQGIEWADRRRHKMPSPLPTQRSGEVNPTTIFTATPTP